MDPVSVVGVIAASVQIAHFIGLTIQGLSTLKGKFHDADTTIRLLIGQLSTIKAAILQIRDWAEYNFDDSPKEQGFLKGLNVALDGCQAAMDVLSEEVKDLVGSVETSPEDPSIALRKRTRAKVAWSESSMKIHQDRLYGQVQALQLLLLAGQCRDAMSQSQLLGLKENQKLLKKVADDTKTLRESHSSVASQATHTLTSRPFDGVLFEFDERLEETQPYQAVAAREASSSRAAQARPITRKPVASPTPRNDEGYETGTHHSGAPSPALSRNPSRSLAEEMPRPQNNGDIVPDSNNISSPNVFRSKSLASSSPFEPAVRRWLSSSSTTTDSPPPDDWPGVSRKSKFWQSKLARLNTFNASKSRLAVGRAHSVSSSFSGSQRWRRDVTSNTYQSIDFTSPESLNAPALVRDAQAGNVVEIERLLENGQDIEARHPSTQQTALAVAAHCGSVDVVSLLLRHRAKFDTRDRDQATPLHLAASRGHCGALSRLLEVDVDIEATDKEYKTALWVAADQGHLKAVDMLLKRGAKVNARANDQLSALHVAAKQGDREMAELLLRHNAHMEARDSHFRTALHHACSAGHSAVAEFLIQKGTNIEARGKDSMSPFICAAAAGHCHVLDLLTKKKASPRSIDDNKANSLHWAARNGHLEVVEYLIAARLPLLDTDAEGLTPLHLAVRGSHFAIVDFLIQKNAAVENACQKGWTPLHYACSSYNADVVRLLLSAGAKPEGRVSADGRRPIHIVAANGSAEIVEILHDKGVDIGGRDSAGSRPLCIACDHGHVEVVQKLLDCGEPLRKKLTNSPNEDSPLCIAAKGGHLEIVRILIRKGASVKQRDEYGYIPLRYAAYYGHPEVLRLLLEEGAELVDDGEDSNGWGFVLMPDMIGFSDSGDITEERKRLVRELLEEAESNMHWWDKDDSITAFRPGAPEGGPSHLLGNSPRPELSGSVGRSPGSSSQGGAFMTTNGFPAEPLPVYFEGYPQNNYPPEKQGGYMQQPPLQQQQQPTYNRPSISELDAHHDTHRPSRLNLRRVFQGAGMGRLPMRMATTRGSTGPLNRPPPPTPSPMLPDYFGYGSHIERPYAPTPFTPDPFSSRNPFRRGRETPARMSELQRPVSVDMVSGYSDSEGPIYVKDRDFGNQIHEMQG